MDRGRRSPHGRPRPRVTIEQAHCRLFLEASATMPRSMAVLFNFVSDLLEQGFRIVWPRVGLDIEGRVLAEHRFFGALVHDDDTDAAVRRVESILRIERNRVG